MKACQIILAALLVISFFFNLWTDFYGKKARSPDGFYGAVSTVILTAILGWIYWKAGAFSTILT